MAYLPPKQRILFQEVKPTEWERNCIYLYDERDLGMRFNAIVEVVEDNSTAEQEKYKVKIIKKLSVEGPDNEFEFMRTKGYEFYSKGHFYYLGRDKNYKF